MRRALLLFFFIAGTFSGYAQDDLMNMLDSNKASGSKEPVTATFKATRIINSNSVQNLNMGVLDFRILHRFGSLHEGAKNFFGLDNANTQIALDYGITDWLMVNIAHNTYNKENSGFAKVRVLRQRKGGMPITLSLSGEISIDGMEAPKLAAGQEWKFSNRMFYTNQLLIARKFNDRLSLQLMPTLVHFNLVDSSKFSNNTIAIGAGGRMKVSRRVAITAEYFYRATNADLLVRGLPTYNSFSIGVDIETGGHVFQMMLTNSQGITGRTVVGQTMDTWEKGQIHFGFNISRVFTILRPKEFK